MSETIPIIRNAPPPPKGETRGAKGGAPKPPRRPKRRYPWDKLRVGDAFDVPLAPIPLGNSDRHPDYNAITASVSNRNKKYPERYVVRIRDGHWARVWRVK